MDFETLLGTILSPNNDERNAAAAQIEHLKETDSDALVVQLLAVLSTCRRPELRTMSAVLLRRHVGNADTSIWDSFRQAATKQMLLDQLLMSLQHESERSVRAKITDTVGSIGAFLMRHVEEEQEEESAPGQDDDAISVTGWPQLFPTLLQMASSGNPALVVSSFDCFAHLSNTLSEPELVPHLPVLGPLLHAAIASPTAASKEVQSAAIGCICSLTSTLETPQYVVSMSQLLPNMMSCLAGFLQAGDEASAEKVLKDFVMLVEECPDFFASQLRSVLEAMIKIAGAFGDLSPAVRHMALEFIELHAHVKPQPIAKMTDLLTAAVGVALAMLLRIDNHDPVEWLNSWDEAENSTEDESDDYGRGLVCLDALAQGLQNNKTVQSAVLAFVEQNSSSPNWKARHASLMAISQVTEGLPRSFAKVLPQVVPYVLRELQPDASIAGSERIRYAACHCMAQMSTDFVGEFQRQFHRVVLPALMQTIASDPNVRVVGYAVTALITFANDADSKYMTPYYDPLLEQLHTLLARTGNNPTVAVRRVQEECLSAIAAVAGSAEALFVRYYDIFMPILTGILAAPSIGGGHSDSSAVSKRDHILRGKAMEAASLIGMAVGKERFMTDARILVEHLVRAQQQQQQHPDQPLQLDPEYLPASWGRIAKCLGNDFVPFLPLVIPPLLQTASMKVDATLSAEDSEALVGQDSAAHGQQSRGNSSIGATASDDTIVFGIKGQGDKRIHLSTSAMEEKSAALHMLFSYCNDLPAGFAPYVTEVAQTVVPLFTFPFMEDIRIVSWNFAPALARSLLSGAEQQQLLPEQKMASMTQFLEFVYDSLVAACAIEPEERTACYGIASLSELVTIFTALGGSLNEMQVSQAFRVFEETLRELLPKRQEALAKRHGHTHSHSGHGHGHHGHHHGHDDDEELEAANELLETQNDLLSDVEDLLATVTASNVAAGLPMFVEKIWVPLFQPLLGGAGSSKDSAGVRVAICACVDFVEKARVGPGSDLFAQVVLPVFLRFANAQQVAEVVQAAVYGLGAIASLITPEHATVAKGAVEAILAYLASPRARKEEYESATCNAVSALGHYLVHTATVPLPLPSSVEELWKVWISFLPVCGDEEEAQLVHGVLLSQILAGNAALARPEHLSKIMKALGGAAFRDLIAEKNYGEVKRVMEGLRSTTGVVFERIWSQELNEDERNAVLALMGTAS